MSDQTDPTMRIPSESLLVVAGRATGAVIPIPAGQLTLGRDGDQIGRLGGDPTISRLHARITRDERGAPVLEDLGSTNGTFVNGTRVTGRQPLRPGDVVELGESRLEVRGLPGATPGQDRAVPAAPTTQDGPGGWGGAEAPTSHGFGVPPRVPFLGAAEPAAPAPGPRGGGGDDRRPAQPARPPEAGRGPATVEGQIRGIQQRTETYSNQTSEQVWTFRIERYDDSGNRLPPVAVQLRGWAFDGSLHEGDEVRVSGKWRGGTLHSDKVQNLTTSATVGKRSYKGQLIGCLVVLALFVIGILVVFTVAGGAFEQQTEEARQRFCEQAAELGGDPPPGC